MTARKLLSALAIAGSALALSVAPAAAAHCDETAGPGSSGGAGNSNFADHVQDNPHNEGGHNGWASCEDQANNESSRDA